MCQIILIIFSIKKIKYIRVYKQYNDPTNLKLLFSKILMIFIIIF